MGMETGALSYPGDRPEQSDGQAAAGRGLFIAIEGIDGVGKTTQVERLAARIEAAGRQVWRVREPGGTGLGERLREILLARGELSPTPRAELLLFMAARAQLCETVIRPELATGKVVLADRFLASSVAYQGGGLGLPVEEIAAVGAFAVAGCKPHLTLLLDLDPRAAAQRRSGNQGDDRIEVRGRDYQSRVRESFLAQARAGSLTLVAAAGTPDEVAARVWEHVHDHLDLL